jgi:tellurite resistance protein TerC
VEHAGAHHDPLPTRAEDTIATDEDRLIQPWFWVAFNVFVLAMLALDLGVFRGRDDAVSFREALVRSAIWIGLALTFAGVLYEWQGQRPALEFVTGYVIELSLSVDNLFVFLLIFRYFSVPQEHQQKVLIWGILGALALRAVFIFAGVGLLRRFHVITYLFGAILVYSGIKLFREGESEIQPEKNPVLRLFRKFVPVTKDFEGNLFFVRRRGLYATPLFVVLLVVETTDVVFAVDSIPAILAITLNAFVVYTSNVFAILGLRAMYFALAGMLDVFHYLHFGLAVILMFVGAKMLGSSYVEIPTVATLAIVGLVLAVSIGASLLKPRRSAA